MIESVEAIERVRTTYFHGLVWCSVAVAAAVILEDIDEFFEWVLSKPWIAYRLPIFLLVDPDRYKRRLKRIARVFWFALFVGVAGEGVFEVLVSGQDNMLQNFTSERLEAAATAIRELKTVSSQALKDSNAAIAQSGRASSKASLAESKASLAESASGTALDKVEKADANLVRLQGETKDAEARLAKVTSDLGALESLLQLKLTEVVAHLESRVFDSKVFVEMLRKAPKAKAVIWYPGEDGEAFSIASQIATSVGSGLGSGSAGWRVIGFGPIPKNAGPPSAAHLPSGIRFGTGMLIMSSPKSNELMSKNPNTAPLGILADALMKATRNPEQHQMSFLTDPAMKDDEFIIIVGQKPYEEFKKK